MTTSVTTAGGNLWAIAAAQLSDATQAWRIASLNSDGVHLLDPFLSGVMTLQIPAPDPSQTGGLPPQ